LLGARGVTVHTGPVISARTVARGATRDRLAATGASTVDTESYWMLRHRDPGRSWCVRVVADTVSHRVLAPRTLLAVRAALGRLPVVGAALGEFESTAREVRADGGTAAASR
jgi:4-hydroxy-3-methylbut-2-enyl diphosphate reductase